MKTSSYILFACIAMAVTMSITNYETTKNTSQKGKWQPKRAVAAEAIKHAAEQAITESTFTCSQTASSKTNSVLDGNSWFTTTSHHTCISCDPLEPKWVEWEYENDFGQDSWTAKEEDSLIGIFVPKEEVPAWILNNNCA